MVTEIKPLAEITHEALALLCQRLGVANTIRFMNQFTVGYGDYTQERREIFGQMSLDEIKAEMEQARDSSSSD